MLYCEKQKLMGEKKLNSACCWDVLTWKPSPTHHRCPAAAPGAPLPVQGTEALRAGRGPGGGVRCPDLSSSLRPAAWSTWAVEKKQTCSGCYPQPPGEGDLRPLFGAVPVHCMSWPGWPAAGCTAAGCTEGTTEGTETPPEGLQLLMQQLAAFVMFRAASALERRKC